MFIETNTSRLETQQYATSKSHEFSRCDIRVIIKFLSALNTSPMVIQYQLNFQLSREKKTHNLCKQFWNGCVRSKVGDQSFNQHWDLWSSGVGSSRSQDQVASQPIRSLRKQLGTFWQKTLACRCSVLPGFLLFWSSTISNWSSIPKSLRSFQQTKLIRWNEKMDSHLNGDFLSKVKRSQDAWRCSTSHSSMRCHTRLQCRQTRRITLREVHWSYNGA